MILHHPSIRNPRLLPDACADQRPRAGRARSGG